MISVSSRPVRYWSDKQTRFRAAVTIFVPSTNTKLSLFVPRVKETNVLLSEERIVSASASQWKFAGFNISDDFRVSSWMSVASRGIDQLGRSDRITQHSRQRKITKHGECSVTPCMMRPYGHGTSRSSSRTSDRLVSWMLGLLFVINSVQCPTGCANSRKHVGH